MTRCLLEQANSRGSSRKFHFCCCFGVCSFLFSTYARLVGCSPSYTEMNRYLVANAGFNSASLGRLIEELLPRVHGKRSENSVLLYTGNSHSNRHISQVLHVASRFCLKCMLQETISLPHLHPQVPTQMSAQTRHSSLCLQYQIGLHQGP